MGESPFSAYRLNRRFLKQKGLTGHGARQALFCDTTAS
jgi:hypothetical protein